MANGETLKEVRALLNDEIAMPSKAVQRLTLSMLADLYEAVHEAQGNEDVRHAKIDADLNVLKSKNIVLWIEQNKPVAAVLSVLVFIVFMFMQDVAVPWIAKALGLP